MSWNDNDDRENHPAWCFCKECGGDGDNVASHDEPGEVFRGDSELSATVDETVALIRATVRNITRTVLQAYRHLNHYERNFEQMSFDLSNRGGNNTGRVGERRSKGLPFLDAQKDLGADKRRVKILWSGDPKDANVNATWAVVTLKLESVNSRVRRLWTLGQSNPCLDVLIQHIGSDAHKWWNRELWMWCDTNNPSETPFVRMEVIPLDETVAATATANAGQQTGSM